VLEEAGPRAGVTSLSLATVMAAAELAAVVIDVTVWGLTVKHM